MFKQGRHIYSFSEHCDQDTVIKLNDETTKIFLSTKGTTDDVAPDVKAFLDYVDSGIIQGQFVKKLDAAVMAVKSNRKVRRDFMTLQMYLLEHEMKAEERGRTEGIESVAINMLRRGKPLEALEEIKNDTGLSLQRIQELAKEHCPA